LKRHWNRLAIGAEYDVGRSAFERAELADRGSGSLRKDDDRASLPKMSGTCIHHLEAIVARDIAGRRGGGSEEGVAMEISLYDAIGLRHLGKENDCIEQRRMVRDDKDARIPEATGIAHVKMEKSREFEEAEKCSTGVVDDPLKSKGFRQGVSR